MIQYSEVERVEHPEHYQGKIEAIDMIDSVTEGLEGVIAFDIGNVVKYVSRFTKKNGLEDLRKAMWYLNDAIRRYEK